LNHRDVEDLLAERGITVSYESIQLWCNKFRSKCARHLKKKHQAYGDTFFIDEVFVRIDVKQHYLWRAVDQDGEVVDVFLPACFCLLELRCRAIDDVYSDLLGLSS
jgi:putative transposase